MIAGMPVPGYEFVTRLGERVAAHERPLQWISATRRLALPVTRVSMSGLDVSS
jgi:hypothetical protein